MKGAVLEVFLVSAEGIGSTGVVGNSSYHVIAECGAQMCRSKTSSRILDKIYWNEKFTFELPQRELETLSHLRLRIVKDRYFSDDESVGESVIFLKRIILEGNYKGWIALNPAPLNIVDEDGTYNGQITFGLKFIPNTVLNKKGRQCMQEGNHLGKSTCKKIVQWCGLFSSCCGYSNFVNKHKEN